MRCDALALLKRLQIVWHRDSSSEGNVSGLSYMCVKLRSSQAFAGDGESWRVGHRARWGKEQQQCEKGNHKPSSLRRQKDVAAGHVCIKREGLG